jgi:chemotaxis protein CheD
MADCRVGDGRDQVLTTYALGSCIGLAVCDRAAGVGGLLHFMLPDSALDPERAQRTPHMFADTGIPRLLQEVYAKGGDKRRLIVLAAGAANMLDAQGILEIGKRNYLALRRILWKSGLLIHGEAIGGSVSRTMRVEIATGTVWLQEAGERRELTPAIPKKGGCPWHIAS